ncbi:MAG: hypothetical protein NZ853_09770 [Leptospiraceae bacterium]|nr:hypothetical protein [Leptospiraceae bacterium]MDW7976983.1 hypothetical protein [Leptospiraceae bacterium]
MFRKSFRINVPNNQNSQKIPKLHLLFIFFIFWSCQIQSPKSPLPPNHHDFFYGKDFIQIIGYGRIPNSQKEPYEHRLNQCVKEAQIHAHSKWLGITEKYIESQRLWYDQLKNNYYSLWRKCLDEAKIQEIIPIFPNQCKIIVHYYCDPQEW